MAEYTRRVLVGGLPIGGGAPVSIQSMTNTPTTDREATLSQIRALAQAGCQIVRISVYNEQSAQTVRFLSDQSPVPLVADIHFDHHLAILAAENGIAKLRINPGNIGPDAHVKELVDCARMHRIPIRIGVNSGSIPKDMLDAHGGPTPKALLESALRHVRLLEKYGFQDIVVSLKAADVVRTIQAGRLASRAFDYPLHLGVTEAGTPGIGSIKAAIGIGSLLADGIGDTVRVSLTGDPVPEVAAARDILRAVGLWGGVDIISCPTCGRTGIDVEGIVRRVTAETAHITAPLKVAVMGCVVNGPGEAREADVGVAGGKDSGILFMRGEKVRVVRGDLAQALLDAIFEIAGPPPHNP